VSVQEKLRAALASAPSEVLAAYLYGSQARGTAGSGSDVDVAVLLAQPPVPTLRSIARDLEATLEAELGIPTEVVTLNGAPPDLVHRVLRDGVIVLDRDRSARIRFEVQSRNEYFDLEPIRRLYRKLPA
jgi:predicted nucleotidyltransferase